MDQEGFFAVGVLYVGFGDARLKVEDGITLRWELARHTPDRIRFGELTHPA